MNKKFTNEFSLDGQTAIKEIIRFSTIPGTSRHHWGTEIDIIDKNLNWLSDEQSTEANGK